MAKTPPNFQAPPAAATNRRAALAEPLLAAVLAAHKAGTLEELLRRRPRLTAWLARRLLTPVRAIAGDAVSDDAADPLAWQLLLRASLARLRPDSRPGLDGIEAQDWLERPAWRPLLALACHFGFVAVPALPGRHRPRADETAAEQLCALWDVNPSSYYRYLDKGRKLLADALFEAPQGERRLARDALLQHEVQALLKLEDPAARLAWHSRQAALALDARDAPGALWHLARARDVDGFIRCVQRFRIELGSDPATDALVQSFEGSVAAPRQRVEMRLALAGLWRVRGVEAGERQALDEALRVASTSNEPLLLGIVYGALGKFEEVRDAERAFACYQDAAEFLRQAGLHDDPAAAEPALLEAYVETLVKLAWLYVLRKDPRSRAVLDRAESLREHVPHDAEVLAMLEQAWGEYWRRGGDLRRALEHKHRALHIYERLGDRQSILKTWCNLSLVYADAKDFARAIDYSQRVLQMAERFAVEPETVASTHLNVGAAYFWQGKYDPAIEHYRQALDVGLQAKLRIVVGRAHYNLAEAYYKRFQALDDRADEERGDAHAAAALASWPEGGDAAAAEATRNLKREILGPRDEPFVDRLLPGELAAHFDAMSEVQRQRAALALAPTPHEQAAAHLAIARAYLEIAVAEREAALALIDRHGLGDRFDEQIERLRATFGRGLSREHQLVEAWRQPAGSLLKPAQSAELLRHLLADGSINKSGYARLFGVGPATASKHLALLAERGLLVRSGSGPSTRYALPG